MAKNQAPTVYCNAIEEILLAYIYQIVLAETESNRVSRFRNGEDDKECICVHKGDDKDEDSSEFSKNSEGNGDRV